MHGSGSETAKLPRLEAGGWIWYVWRSETPMLKKIAIGIVLVLAMLVLVGFLLPSSYHAERSTTIQAPPERVFELVNDLEKNERWSPWMEADPSMKLTYSETTVGQGAWSSWTSEDMGSGKQTIRESVPPRRIVTDLDFMEQGTATGTWTFDPSADGTRVTWAIDGDSGGNLIGRYFGLLMDKMIGPEFERGLANLKRVAESPAT